MNLHNKIAQLANFGQEKGARDLIDELLLLTAPGREGRGEYSGDPETEWQNFWKDIVAPDGVIDVEQIKKELSDFSMILDFVPKVYMHATGGMVSYAHMMPDTVCGLIDDHVSNLCKDDDTDTARLDWIEGAVTEGVLTSCFEIEGGIFLDVERPGEEKESYRNKNNVRDAIDEAQRQAALKRR